MTDRATKEKIAAEQVAAIGILPDGVEPTFLPHPLLDALLESVIALGGELWIERDRRQTLEALLAEKGLVTQEEIEGWQPNAEQRQARSEELEVLTERLLGSLRAHKSKAE